MVEPISRTRDYYDALAGQYELETDVRRRYLDVIDAIVIRWAMTHGASTVLDVGCGNGRRLRRIVTATGARGVGIDVSPSMVASARGRGLEAHVADIVDLRDGSAVAPGSFDLVVALWNVLGHVGSDPERRRAVANMRFLTRSGGALIVDVNNRHNAAAYGWGRAVRNLVLDALRPGRTGDFAIHRSVAGRDVATVSHLFSLGEIVGLCRAAALEPAAVHFIDYADGSERRSRWGGQICVVAVPAG